MDDTHKDEFLEISWIPGHADMHAMELSRNIQLGHINHDVYYQNSCVESFENVQEYFVNVYKD